MLLPIFFFLVHLPALLPPPFSKIGEAMFSFVFICPAGSLCISLSVCLPVCLSICLFVRVRVYQSVGVAFFVLPCSSERQRAGLEIPSSYSLPEVSMDVMEVILPYSEGGRRAPSEK